MLFSVPNLCFNPIEYCWINSNEKGSKQNNHQTWSTTFDTTNNKPISTFTTTKNTKTNGSIMRTEIIPISRYELFRDVTDNKQSDPHHPSSPPNLFKDFQMPTTNSNGNSINNNSSNNNSNNASQQQQQQQQQQQLSGSTARSTTPATQTTENLNREDVRRKTFKNWPHSFLDPNILAMIGFYFVGPVDNVKCYFCTVEIGRWEADDNEVTEHMRWSQNCPLLKRRQTNNIPLDQNALDQILPVPTYDVCGLSGSGEPEIRYQTVSEGTIEPPPNLLLRRSQDSSSSSTSSIGGIMNNILQPSSVAGIAGSLATGSAGLVIPSEHHLSSAPMTRIADHFSSPSPLAPSLQNPVHPEYAIEAARLRSFDDWPKIMKQKPQELSDAGFFYTMKGDRVKCFCCGGGLRDWDENDIPWEQHAQWFQDCEYLKLIKGDEYIEAILAANENASETVGSGEPTENNTSETIQSTEGHSVPVSTSFGSLSQQIRSNSPNNNSESNIITRSSSSTSSTSSSTMSANSNAGGVMASSNIAAPSTSSSLLSSSNGEKKPCESKLCKICYSQEYDTAFLPCGHVVACGKCAASVNKCPMCRKPFDRVIKLYIS